MFFRLATCPFYGLIRRRCYGVGFALAGLSCSFVDVVAQVPGTPEVIAVHAGRQRIEENDKDFTLTYYSIAPWRGDTIYVSGGGDNSPAVYANFILTRLGANGLHLTAYGFALGQQGRRSSAVDPNFSFGKNPRTNIMRAISVYPLGLSIKKNGTAPVEPRGFMLSRETEDGGGGQKPESYLYRLYITPNPTSSNPKALLPAIQRQEDRDFSKSAINVVLAVDTNKAWAAGKGVVKLFNGSHWTDFSASATTHTRTHQRLPLTAADVNPNVQISALKGEDAFTAIGGAFRDGANPDTVWVLSSAGKLVRITYNIDHNHRIANTGTSNGTSGSVWSKTNSNKHCVDSVKDIEFVSSDSAASSSSPSAPSARNTCNGGRTGKQIGNGLPEHNADFSSMSVVSNTHIWVTTRKGKIYHSSDGGVQFCEQKIEGLPPGVPPESISFESIAVPNTKTGMAVSRSINLGQNSGIFFYDCPGASATQRQPPAAGQNDACVWRYYNVAWKEPVPTLHSVAYLDGIEPWTGGTGGLLTYFPPDLAWSCGFYENAHKLLEPISSVLPYNVVVPSSLYFPLYRTNQPKLVPVVHLCSGEVIRCIPGQNVPLPPCSCSNTPVQPESSACPAGQKNFADVSVDVKFRSSRDWEIKDIPASVDLQISENEPPPKQSAKAPGYILRQRVGNGDKHLQFEFAGPEPFDVTRQDGSTLQNGTGGLGTIWQNNRLVRYRYAKSLDSLMVQLGADGFIDRNLNPKQGGLYNMNIRAVAPNFSLSPKITPVRFRMGENRAVERVLYVVQPAMVPRIQAPAQATQQLHNGYKGFRDSFEIRTNTAFTVIAIDRKAELYNQAQRRNGPNLPLSIHHISFNLDHLPGRHSDTPILRKWDQYAKVDSRHDRDTLYFTNSENYINSFETAEVNFLGTSTGPCADRRYMRVFPQNNVCANVSFRTSYTLQPFRYTLGFAGKAGRSSNQIPTTDAHYNARYHEFKRLTFTADGRPKTDSLFFVGADYRYSYQINTGFYTPFDPQKNKKYNDSRFLYTLMQKDGQTSKRDRGDSIAVKASATVKLDELAITNYDTTHQEASPDRGKTKLYVGTMFDQNAIKLRVLKENYSSRVRVDTIYVQVEGYEGVGQMSVSSRRIGVFLVEQEGARLGLRLSGRGGSFAGSATVKLRHGVDSASKFKPSRDSVDIFSSVKWYLKTSRKSSSTGGGSSAGGSSCCGGSSSGSRSGGGAYGQHFGEWYDTLSAVSWEHLSSSSSQCDGSSLGVPEGYLTQAKSGGSCSFSRGYVEGVHPYVVVKATQANLTGSVRRDSLEFCTLDDSVCRVVYIEQDKGEFVWSPVDRPGFEDIGKLMRGGGVLVDYRLGDKASFCLSSDGVYKMELPKFLKLVKCEGGHGFPYHCASLSSGSLQNASLCDSSSGVYPTYDGLNCAPPSGSYSGSVHKFVSDVEAWRGECRRYCVEVADRNESKRVRHDSIKVWISGTFPRVELKIPVVQRGISFDFSSLSLFFPRRPIDGMRVVEVGTSTGWQARGYDKSRFVVRPSGSSRVGGLYRKDKVEVGVLRRNEGDLAVRDTLLFVPLDVCVHRREALSGRVLLVQDSFWLHKRLVRGRDVKYPLESGVGEYSIPAEGNNYLWFYVEANAPWLAGVSRGGRRVHWIERPSGGFSALDADSLSVHVEPLLDFFVPREDSVLLYVVDSVGHSRYKDVIRYRQLSFDFGEENVVVYPNPVLSLLRVRSVHGDKFRNGYVYIYDIGGSLIGRRRYTDGLVDFDFGTLPVGVYILRIYDGKVSVTKKIIRQ